jgi:non-heme chloroperoxidase
VPFYVTDDHVRLYYEVRGTGKPVILLHGLTANHRHFRKQTPELVKDFKVITLDFRGHGDSEAPENGLTLKRLADDLKELIDYLELGVVSLVGWSMGAHVIFEYIKNFSCEGIEKIIIIDMTPRLMKSDDWKYGLPGVFSRKPGDFGHEDNLFMLSAMLENWGIYSRIVAERILNKSLYNEKMEFNYQADFKGKEDLPWLYDEARKNTPHVIIALWISMSLQDYRPILKEITVPCLITYGLESNYYPPENYEYMKNHIPNAKVVPFEGCGHALHIQDSEKFNRIVIEFLK